MQIKMWPLAAILFLVLGCRPSGDIVGHWQANIQTTGTRDNQLAQGLAKAISGSMSIDFKADHTFAMMMIVPIQGTWSQSGDEVTLIPTTVMGINSTDKTQKPMNLRLSTDGKTLTAEDNKDSSQVTFTRQPASGS